MRNRYLNVMKCLIVEDNTAMRRLLRRLVMELAYETYECQDGFEAVIRYEQIHPDWVLMDIDLPGQDGIKATRELLNAAPAAQVLIVTGYDDTEMRHAAGAAGARGYGLKENLKERRFWLQNRRANEISNLKEN